MPPALPSCSFQLLSQNSSLRSILRRGLLHLSCCLPQEKNARLQFGSLLGGISKPCMSVLHFYVNLNLLLLRLLKLSSQLLAPCSGRRLLQRASGILPDALLCRLLGSMTKLLVPQEHPQDSDPVDCNSQHAFWLPQADFASAVFAS